jgi:hypothetical protein
MTRPTTLIALGGLVTVGIIVADLVTHPNGTKAAANGINNIAKTSVSGLLGKRP